MESKKKKKSQHATFKAGRTDSWHQLITQSARALWAPQQFLLYFLPHEQEKHTHIHVESDGEKIQNLQKREGKRKVSVTCCCF